MTLPSSHLKIRIRGVCILYVNWNVNYSKASQACASIGAHQIIVRTENDRILLETYLTGIPTPISLRVKNYALLFQVGLTTVPLPCEFFLNVFSKFSEKYYILKRLFKLM